MRSWRFLNTGASTASVNMAIDQAMLAMHDEGKSPPTLRIYQWSPPAISLGYFQRLHGIDVSACQRLGIDVIRRPTGGRAVLHYDDITYAVIAGTADGMNGSVNGAYRLLCEGLLSAFHDLGFEAELGSQSMKSPRSDICFLASTSGDILYKGKKFVGSAQTWQRSSMLQHGSIILEPHLEVWLDIQENRSVSRANQETILGRGITSIREILGHVPATNEISVAIQHGIAQVLGVEFQKGELSHEEWSLAHNIINQQAKEVGGTKEHKTIQCEGGMYE